MDGWHSKTLAEVGLFADDCTGNKLDKIRAQENEKYNCFIIVFVIVLDEKRSTS